MSHAAETHNGVSRPGAIRCARRSTHGTRAQFIRYRVAASDELLSAVQLMRARHVGYLVVVDMDLREQFARPVGVLSDRDIVVGVVASEADVRGLRVGDVMTERPVTAAETESIAAALDEMRRVGVRRLPVVGSRGQLVGVVSLDDVLAELAAQLGNVAGAIGKEQRVEAALRP